MLIGVGVDAVGVIEHTVVVHRSAGWGGQLEHLSTAGGSNDSVSGGYSRDDALHYPLCQPVRNTCDACRTQWWLKTKEEKNIYIYILVNFISCSFSAQMEIGLSHKIGGSTVYLFPIFLYSNIGSTSTYHIQQLSSVPSQRSNWCGVGHPRQWVCHQRMGFP